MSWKARDDGRKNKKRKTKKEKERQKKEGKDVFYTISRISDLRLFWAFWLG